MSVLGDVFPGFAPKNRGYRLFRDAVLSRESGIACGSRAVGRSDALNLPSSQFSFRVPLASRNSLWMAERSIPLAPRPSVWFCVHPITLASGKTFWMDAGTACIARSAPVLRTAVGDIIQGRSEEQMLRANAGRIVTTVADPHAFRDRSVVQFPRNAMNTDASTMCTTRKTYPTVWLPWKQTARPYPTLAQRRAMIGNGSARIDMCPESLRHRARCWRHRILSRSLTRAWILSQKEPS